MGPASLPRVRPCASCPYRLDVPSGVWAPEEYAKLEGYDGDTWGQSGAVFGCHSDGGASLCAGWVGHVDHPADLLALRLGVISGEVHPDTLDYTTTVPLFASGKAAADHGRREIERPGDPARAVIAKLEHARSRGARDV